MEYYGGPIRAVNYYQNGSPFVNQQKPKIVVVSESDFGGVPIQRFCQKCQTLIMTNVHKSCNCCSVLLCMFTGLLIWICIQCGRGKELTCCDAKHTCPNCGEILGYYEAC